MIFLWIGSPVYATIQKSTPPDRDTMLVNVYIEKALLFKDSAQYDSSTIYFEKAELIYERTGLWDKWVAAGNEIGDNYFELSKFEKALSQWQQVLSLGHKHLGEEHKEIATSHFYLGRCYHRISKLTQAMEQYQKALDIRLIVLGDNHPKVATSYLSVGSIYRDRSDFDKALEYNEKALPIRINSLGKMHKEVAQVYHAIGRMNRYNGYYSKALQFYNEALNIRLKVLDKDDPDLAYSYHSLGIIYNEQGEYDTAIEHYLKALNIRRKIFGENHLSVAGSYNSLGVASSDKKESEQALIYYQKTLDILLNIFGPKHEFVAMTYLNMGKPLYQKGEHDKEISFYQKALNIYLDIYGPKHQHVAWTYSNFGMAYQGKGEYKKAMDYFQKAFAIKQIVLHTEHPDFIEAYNNFAEVYKNTGDYDQALTNYKKALEVILKVVGPEHPDVAASHNDIGKIYYLKQDHVKAVEHFEIALSSLDKMKKNYSSSASKQFHLSHKYVIFENAIQSLLEAANVDPGQFDLKLAFLYAEKSKGNLLQEALNKTRAESFAGISDELLEKEQSYSVNIAKYEESKFEEMSKGPAKNDSLISVYHDKLFDLHQNYNTLISQFETSYPEYYRLKYDNAVCSVDEVQKQLLLSDQTLVEYFVGEDNIFVFLLKPDDYQVHHIEKNFPLEEWVRQMRRGLYYYQLTGKGDDKVYKAYCDTFVMASTQLYKRLIAPFESSLSSSLIIVPDGVLSYIPFDVLLKERPDQSHHFKTHAYLLREHQISYSYSATLLKESYENKNKARKGLLAFAPSFEDRTLRSSDLEKTRASLGTLKYNTPEAKQICAIMGGDIFIGETATEKKFTQLANQYQILHLATHGKANDKMGDYSFLAFTEIKDSLENERLYVRDLYNLKLNADMVVLSACETGIGELQKGEGVISLARGFSYAGAKSILTTLWSVNDKNTSELMTLFYQNIKNGMTKDEGLRNAKLAYMEQQSHLGSHPFYWAGFVPIGNMGTVTVSSSFAGMWKIGLLFLGIILFFLWRKRSAVI